MRVSLTLGQVASNTFYRYGPIAATTSEAARNSVQLTFGNRRVQFGSNSKGLVGVSLKYF